MSVPGTRPQQTSSREGVEATAHESSNQPTRNTTTSSAGTLSAGQQPWHVHEAVTVPHRGAPALGPIIMHGRAAAETCPGSEEAAQNVINTMNPANASFNNSAMLPAAIAATNSAAVHSETTGASTSTGVILSAATHPASVSKMNSSGGVYASNTSPLGQVPEEGFPLALSINTAPSQHGGHRATPLLVKTPDAQQVARTQDPIGPIQPIGRPRPSGSLPPHEQTIDYLSHTPQERKSNVPEVDRVLGSAALSSGDDEVVIPTPRRVSHGHNALGTTWNAGSSMSTSHWGTAFAATPTPIWGRSSLSPGAVHTWPVAGNSGSFVPRYDVPGALAEPFSARIQQQEHPGLHRQR